MSVHHVIGDHYRCGILNQISLPFSFPVFPVPVRGAKPASSPPYDDVGNLQSGDFVAEAYQVIALCR